MSRVPDHRQFDGFLTSRCARWLGAKAIREGKTVYEVAAEALNRLADDDASFNPEPLPVALKPLPEKRPVQMSDKERRLLAMLMRAARLGEPSPSYDAIRKALKLGRWQHANRLFSQLEQIGAISVRWKHGKRIVTVLATGKATAEPEPRDPRAGARMEQIVAEISRPKTRGR